MRETKHSAWIILIVVLHLVGHVRKDVLDHGQLRIVVLFGSVDDHGVRCMFVTLLKAISEP